MIFEPLKFPGAYLIHGQPVIDDRGRFERIACRFELGEVGLSSDFVQSSLSFNSSKGTIRGMHMQRPPHSEDKLIRCVRGAIYDVLVDVRPDSPTFRQWLYFELTEDNHRSLYVPKGVAHGFQTLRDTTEVLYQMTYRYVAEASVGFRHDDPAFSIDWPLDVSTLSEKDAQWPDFASHEFYCTQD